MVRMLPIFLVLTVSCIFNAGGQEASPEHAINVAATDWPWWRGPHRNGIADPNQQLSLKWSEQENVLWKSPVPGRGHASPTVVGERIFLATADEQQETQSVVCYHRQTGKQLWHTEIHRGGFPTGGNVKNSHAGATIGCDGDRVFVNFLNRGAIFTTALSTSGRQLWQTRVTDYVLHNGFGSSPALYSSLVIVSADNKGGGVVAGLERSTGKMIWSVPRPKTQNHISPIILRIADRDQLVLTGQLRISSFDPLTGKKHWESKGPTSECVTGAVTDGTSIFTGGMHPQNHIAAVCADGSGRITWEKPTKIYVPSMLVHREHLFAVNDHGIAVCLDCKTGKEAWKDRLQGNFSASLVLANDHLFAASESGRTYIFRANPKAFELIADNRLGDEVLATPAICGNRIYLRVANRQGGNRKEFLYCVGKQ